MRVSTLLGGSALALLVAACARPRTRPLGNGERATVASADARVVAGPPEQLVVQVDLANRTRDTLTLEFDSNVPLSIRLYREGAGPGAPPAFDQAKRLPISVTTGELGVMVGTGLLIWVAPGKVSTFRHVYRVSELLSDTLSSGSYQVMALLAGAGLGGREIDAGTVDLRAVPVPLPVGRPAEEAIFTAKTTFASAGPPTVLEVTMFATSISSTTSTLALSTGGCPLSLLLYRTRAARDSTFERIPDAVFAPHECEAVHGRIELERQRPRTVASFSAAATDILGDSLSDGHYYLAARLRIAQSSPILVSAGEADLERR